MDRKSVAKMINVWVAHKCILLFRRRRCRANGWAYAEWFCMPQGLESDPCLLLSNTKWLQRPASKGPCVAYCKIHQVRIYTLAELDQGTGVTTYSIVCLMQVYLSALGTYVVNESIYLLQKRGLYKSNNTVLLSPILATPWQLWAG